MVSVAQSTASTRTLRPGTKLGPYTIVRRIGVGGMAELYLGRASGPGSFEKAFAVKVVHPHLVDDPSSIRMFMREARVAAGLDHPGIVQVVDFGCDAGEYYLAMEYVHGRDARQVMAALPEGDPMPLACALQVVASVADALHYAHRAQTTDGLSLAIVHRDISPANILLGYRGAVKLGDFGIAKFRTQGTSTGTGILKGKLGYMAPEQCLHENLDQRCDVFALGVVLYELSTGTRAFTGPNPAALMNRVLSGDYVRPRDLHPDYPIELEGIVARSLMVEVEDRTCSAKELAAQIRGFAMREGIVLSQGTLAEWMEGVFGTPAAPSLQVPGAVTHPAAVPMPSTSVIRPGVLTSSIRRRARGRASAVKVAALALGTLGLGTLIGWGLSDGRGHASSARTIEAPARPAPARPGPPSADDAPPEVVSETPAKVSQAAIPPDSPAPVETDEATLTEAAQSMPTSKRTSRAGRKRGTKRRKPSPEASTRDEAGDERHEDSPSTRDAMFPSSAR